VGWREAYTAGGCIKSLNNIQKHGKVEQIANIRKNQKDGNRENESRDVGAKKFSPLEENGADTEA